MSEINHEAAKVYAAECCQFYKECITDIGHKMSNIEQRELNISRAYLDLSAQLAAERARVEALAGLVKDQEMYDEGWANPIKKQLDAILEGRDNAD